MLSFADTYDSKYISNPKIGGVMLFMSNCRMYSLGYALSGLPPNNPQVSTYILLRSAANVTGKFGKGTLSRPLLRLLLGDIGFVYDDNRSFASYTKTKTVESEV
jgi:hypothetical protein